MPALQTAGTGGTRRGSPLRPPISSSCRASQPRARTRTPENQQRAIKRAPEQAADRAAQGREEQRAGGSERLWAKHQTSSPIWSASAQDACAQGAGEQRGMGSEIVCPLPRPIRFADAPSFLAWRMTAASYPKLNVAGCASALRAIVNGHDCTCARASRGSVRRRGRAGGADWRPCSRMRAGIGLWGRGSRMKSISRDRYCDRSTACQGQREGQGERKWEGRGEQK